MPGESTKPPGITPGASDTPRPRGVLPAGAPAPQRGPTTIGNTPPTAVPSKIGSPPTTLAPTSVPPPTKIPSRIPAGTAQTPPASPTKPSLLPGKTRQRIPVTLDDLRQLNPIKEEALEQAIRLIQVIDLDGMTDESAIYWGQASQEEYGQLMSRSLELNQSDVLVDAARHIGRLQELLGEVDLKDIENVGDGLLARLAGNTWEKVSEEIAARQREFSETTRVLNDKKPQLLETKRSLEEVLRNINKQACEIEAHALAAQFLSNHLKGPGPDPDRRQRLCNILASRSLSLTQTVADIRSAQTLHQSQIEHPLKLIAIIQDTVLVQIPSWVGSYAAVGLSLQSKRQPTKTLLDELGQQLKRIQREIVS